MEWWQAVLLGVVQGITEWLPVSSTAHLVLVPWLLGWEIEKPIRDAFDVLVQDGTLLAVVVYFRRDLLQILRSRLAWLLLAATIPAGLAGLALQHRIEALHDRPVVVAAILLLATPILFLGERFGRKDRREGDLGLRDVLGIGFAQALAILPGVSRSAATISGGMLAGLDRAGAARFSFLLSIPILAAAGAKKSWDLAHVPGAADALPALLAGCLAAAVVGYATIHWLLGYLGRRPVTDFAWYRIGAGLLLLGLALYRG